MFRDQLKHLQISETAIINLVNLDKSDFIWFLDLIYTWTDVKILNCYTGRTKFQ